MTILLYKDGRLVIDDGNPIEGNSLEGLVACVTDPQSGDTLKFDGKQWVAGAAASGLPAVSGTDNGKVLTVVEGEWAPAAASGGSDIYLFARGYDEAQDKTYIDATCAELKAAAEAGKWLVNVELTTGINEFTYNVLFANNMQINTYGDTYSLSLTLQEGNGTYYNYVADSPDDKPYEYSDD